MTLPPADRSLGGDVEALPLTDREWRAVCSALSGHPGMEWLSERLGAEPERSGLIPSGFSFRAASRPSDGNAVVLLRDLASRIEFGIRIDFDMRGEVVCFFVADSRHRSNEVPFHDGGFVLDGSDSGLDDDVSQSAIGRINATLSNHEGLEGLAVYGYSQTECPF